jgi:HPt (histidine-containing phosphotransfer) domain-containing protein
VGPVFDFEAALRRWGDRRLYDDLVRFFVEDAPKLLEEVRRGLRDQDARAVEHGAHTLKGLAANFDAAPAIAVAFQVEQSAWSSSLAEATALLPKLEAEFDRLRQALLASQRPGSDSSRDSGKRPIDAGDCGV